MKKTAPNKTLIIEGISHDFRGISHIDDKVVFVAGALPGEQVLARQLQNKSRYEEWQTVRIEQTSAERVEPFCEYFALCGGCDIQHCSYTTQVRYKEENLQSQLTRSANLQSVPLTESITSPSTGYRRRARLACNWSNDLNRLIIGFRERSGKAIVEINHCAVLEPALEKLLEPLVALLNQINGLRLGHIELMLAEDDSSGVCLDIPVVYLHKLSSLESCDNILKQFATQQRINLSYTDNDDTLHLCFQQSAQYYLLQDGRLKLNFEIGDFIQGNRAANKQLVKQALAWLAPQPEDTIIDCFAGLGNFSLPLAQFAGQVIALEGALPMVNMGVNNALANGLDNISFRRVDLFNADALPKLPCDKLLLDPPRDGAFILCQNMALFNPQRIVYVSCNPASFARDATVLCRNGYVLAEIKLVDMFPHTVHSEVIALFHRSQMPTKNRSLDPRGDSVKKLLRFR